jgi:hypothetical protein
MSAFLLKGEGSQRCTKTTLLLGIGERKPETQRMRWVDGSSGTLKDLRSNIDLVPCSMFRARRRTHVPTNE